MRFTIGKIIIIIIFFLIIFFYTIFKSSFTTFIPIEFKFTSKTYYIASPKILYNIYDNFFGKIYKNKINSCIKNNNTKIADSYKFFAAGHIYGQPNTKELGIYKNFLTNINTKNNINFGFFTGDIVRESNKKSWDTVDQQIADLDFPIYFIPGNHDVGIGDVNKKREIFKKRYLKTFQSFFYNNDLFILLDTNYNNWNISDYQIEEVKKLLIKANNISKNVFIFSHQVIWFNKNNFHGVSINSDEGLLKNKKTNYWTTFKPILSKYDLNYYIIAGDTGAWINGRELFCKKQNNFTYLASGMGNGSYDNYLIFESNGKNVNIYPQIF